MDKLFSRYCPKCNELYSNLEIAKVNLGSGVQINMQCENGHKWSEFFFLTYAGYWYTGTLYDSYGNALKEDNAERVDDNAKN